MASNTVAGADARLNEPQEHRREADAPVAAVVTPEGRALALQAAWEIEALADAALALMAAGSDGADLAVRGIAIRVRDLAGASMTALDDNQADLGDVHRTVYGTARAAEGAAS